MPLHPPGWPLEPAGCWPARAAAGPPAAGRRLLARRALGVKRKPCGWIRNPRLQRRVLPGTVGRRRRGGRRGGEEERAPRREAFFAALRCPRASCQRGTSDELAVSRVGRGASSAKFSDCLQFCGRASLNFCWSLDKPPTYTLRLFRRFRSGLASVRRSPTSAAAAAAGDLGDDAPRLRRARAFAAARRRSPRRRSTLHRRRERAVVLGALRALDRLLESPRTSTPRPMARPRSSTRGATGPRRFSRRCDVRHRVAPPRGRRLLLGRRRLEFSEVARSESAATPSAASAPPSPPRSAASTSRPPPGGRRRPPRDVARRDASTATWSSDLEYARTRAPPRHPRRVDLDVVGDTRPGCRRGAPPTARTAARAAAPPPPPRPPPPPPSASASPPSAAASLGAR